MLAGQASFPPGKALARQLRPATTVDEVRRLQAETDGAYRFLAAGGAWSLTGAQDISPTLQRVQRGGTAEGTPLMAVAETAAVMAQVRETLTHQPDALLAAMAQGLPHLPGLVTALRRALDKEGNVRDDASPQLYELRRRAPVLQERIRERLAGFLRGETARYLQERLVTLRESRFVLPVKAEYRGRVPGIVHGQSASGATVFVEPTAVVELNNRLRETTAAEEREVQRVLAQLSRQVAAEADPLAEGLAALARLDAVFARARLATKMDARPPVIVDRPQVNLVGARHPLLGPEAVPIDIRLGEDFDLLVITGPNTGGKTVTLKTTGLLVMMAQAGMYLPVAGESRVGVFRQVFADIGDEQSIQQNLSTFSAHMSNVVSFVHRADDRSLVLLDEIGAGTDPDEGSALAVAILRHFLRKGARVIATTHHSRLKAFALAEPRAANASVAFDAETLAPTYRLVIGVPGRSHAITIAARLGMPREILAGAQKWLDPGSGRLEEAIAGAEDIHREMEGQRQRLAQELREVQALRRELEEKLAAVAQQRARWLSVTREETTAHLNRLTEEAEELLAQLRQAVREGTPAGEAVGEKTRRRLAQIRQETGSVLAETAAQAEKQHPEMPAPSPAGPSAPKEGEAPWPPRPGDAVWVPALGQAGELMHFLDEGRSAMVRLGALTMKVAVKDLAPPPAGTAPAPAPVPAPEHPGEPLAAAKAAHIPLELHLRGMTVDEALAKLDKYLDDALLAGLTEVRIVHGKGTGTLRGAVQRFLKEDRRVDQAHLAPAHEGGLGVTVVRLKA